MSHKVIAFRCLRDNIPFYSKILLMIVLLLCTGCCILNNIENPNKVIMLRDRADAMYSLWKDGDVASRYDFLWPELRNIIQNDYYLSNGPYIQKLENYRIESIAVEDGIGMVVLRITFLSRKEIEEIKWFTYWGYHNGNWYVIDDIRSMPYQRIETERFKKIIKDGMPDEMRKSLKKSQADWKDAQKRKK